MRNKKNVSSVTTAKYNMTKKAQKGGALIEKAWCKIGFRRRKVTSVVKFKGMAFKSVFENAVCEVQPEGRRSQQL